MFTTMFRSRNLIKNIYNYRLKDFNLKNTLNARKPLISCIGAVRGIYSSRVFQRREIKPTITFVLKDGRTQVVAAEVGDSIFDVVLDNEIDAPGYGICGGTCACSTCHIIFKEEDFKKIPNRVSTLEKDILDFAPGTCPTSRLGCQIIVSEDMDGLVLRVPERRVDLRLQEQTTGLRRQKQTTGRSLQEETETKEEKST